LQLILDGLQILYSYQLNMSLLNKIAESSEGSEMLMRANIFNVLETCEFLDIRPELNEYEGN
jgi:nuclear pore complex protein Nup205